jgi:hypothetical protein
MPHYSYKQYNLAASEHDVTNMCTWVPALQLVRKTAFHSYIINLHYLNMSLVTKDVLGHEVVALEKQGGMTASWNVLVLSNVT